MTSSTTIHTPLLDMFPSMKSPIVCGPMANAAGGSLAGEISKAGGLGFIGAGYYTPEKMQDEIEKAREALGGRDGQDDAGGRMNIGVGFLAWKLTALNGGRVPVSTGDEAKGPAVDLIDMALRAKPCAIWMAFGSQEELAGWSHVARRREEALNGGTTNDMKLFVGVGTTAEAKTAVEDCGADVIVAQGIEAGGHGLGTSPPLTTLLPLVRKMLPTWRQKEDGKVVLLGAGGLHSGSSLVSVLSLGGDGAVYGTRFLLTPEAAYSEAQKKMLLDADEGQTKRTMAFDEARGTTGWPKGVDGRGIVNDTVHDFEGGKGGSAEARRERYKQGESEGDTKRIVTWAGSGVGNMHKLMTAGEVVRELDSEAIAEIKRVAALLVTAPSAST